jgi:hypothetical protein
MYANARRNIALRRDAVEQLKAANGGAANYSVLCFPCRCRRTKIILQEMKIPIQWPTLTVDLFQIIDERTDLLLTLPIVGLTTLVVKEG